MTFLWNFRDQKLSKAHALLGDNSDCPGLKTLATTGDTVQPKAHRKEGAEQTSAGSATRTLLFPLLERERPRPAVLTTSGFPSLHECKLMGREYVTLGCSLNKQWVSICPDLPFGGS